MADLAGFRQMLADRAQSDKGLPHVCLKCSSDFDMELAKLISVDNRQEDESDGQVAGRYVDDICEEIAKPENKGIADKISAVITAFKDKIVAAKQSLTDIRNNARNLARIMDKGKDDILAKDPFVSTHLNLTKLSEDYPVWDWSGPKLIGSSTYIKERVGGLLVASDATVPEEFDYRLYLMACNTISNKIKFGEVQVSEEDAKTFVDSICEVCGESVTREAAEYVVGAITGTVSLRGVMLDVQKLASFPPSELFNRIKEYDGFILKCYPIADAIVSGQVTIPEGDGEASIKANAESLRTLCEFMAYFELMERETVFRQSILLQGGLLNGDEKAAYEKAGGTIQMIAHYIRFMYKDDVAKIPARGISSKVIIESAAHNEKVVKADISNIENRIAVATTQARVNVFRTVAHRYLVNKIDREFGDETPVQKAVRINRLLESLVAKIAARILHHDIAFVDAALMLIVEADYSGTFVEQMYNQLGAAYLAKANATEDGVVSDLDLQVAEMGVVAKMVSGFIVDNLIEVCPQKDSTNRSPVVPSQEG